MIPQEILQKVRLIEIKTRHVVNDIFGGEYHSAFKGKGMEFAEVREYVPGDDIRDIDWNVTARTGKPFIKKFDEERELTVMLMIDVSASGFYGTGDTLKSDLMVELSSVLSFSAIKNNDKVGLILFSDKIEKFIPPQKGKSHVMRIIRELIFYKAEDQKTDISQAIEFVQKVVKRKSVIFLLSDYLDSSFHKPLCHLNNKHDVVSIKFDDPSEIELPNIGMVKFHDSETQESVWIDSTSKKIKTLMKSSIIDADKNLKQFFNKNKIDFIPINTALGYIEPLVSFFTRRTHN
ncbi:MAG: DUF58 domain-containing protein [Candidatus Marinimicrobia bacterium]|nr:DUF58 domain-containing protein [Candidatus Neomarinimicrobiota bacterium]